MSSESSARLREFTFRLHYEAGNDPVMDLFHDNPDVSASALDICTGSGSYLRLLRLMGRPAVTNELEAVFGDHAHGPASVASADCCGTCTSFPLETTTGHRSLYLFVEGDSDCETIQTIVCSRLGRGTLSEVHYHDGVESWRILMPSDDRVGVLYDQISAALREEVRFELGHIGDAIEWEGTGVLAAEVSGSQERALREAVRQGYYERPRGVTLEELAADLDVPRSTLSYRLRMAEAELVKQYVGLRRSEESLPPE
ncbi:helix-turn-helix domain-containing protein [Salinibaculum salinum]|uniref:helix-turn-helix domain-containing protein n=1 Tax=Salinibaculum salinum TaxID=3131996 RepID=UPI0030EB84E9